VREKKERKRCATMREKKNEIELPFVPAKEKFVLLFSPLGKNLFYVKVRVY
jgi:hypothetical protein